MRCCKMNHRLRVWLHVIDDYIHSIKCVKRANLFTSNETIEKLKSSGLSLIRIGDGELNLIEGRSISYQEYSNSLRDSLITAIDTYIAEGEESGYILAMPNEFLKCNGLRLIKKRVWVSSWSHFRRIFKNRYDESVSYGDAFLFSKDFEEEYSLLWQKKENIVFLHNNKIYADFFKAKYGKKVDFIQVARNNSYQNIESTCQQLRDCLKEKNPKDTIVLVSAGPCAKAVVYRLRKSGYQIIDTGHCWDNPLEVRVKK